MSPNLSNVADSVSVITGASTGIGFALAKALVLHGAKAVIITGRSKDKLDKAVEELTKSGPSETTQIQGRIQDASKWEDATELFKSVQDTFGRVDYVFPNATALGGENDWTIKPGEKPDLSPAYDMVNSVVYTIHAALPYLSKSPSKDKAIVITSSESAFSQFDTQIPYGIAKAATNQIVHAYCGTLRDELGGIRINAVSPGWVETPFIADLIAAGGFKDGELTPMEEVIAAFISLVNDPEKTGIIRRVRAEEGTSDYEAIKGGNNSKAYWGPILMDYMSKMKTQSGEAKA